MAGNYRFVHPAFNGNTTETGVLAVAVDGSGNAQVLPPGDAPITLTAGATPCSFTTSDGGSVVVSPAGVALVSSSPEADTKRYPIMLFPEQAVALSEIDGTWNLLAWQRAGLGGLSQPYAMQYGTVAFTAGALNGGTICTAIGSCSTFTPAAGSGLAIDPTGGYAGSGDLATSRGFAYKSGSNILLVIVDQDGSMNILTPQTAQNFPTVGATSTSWNFNENTAGALAVAVTDPLPGISTSLVTITAVDSVNNVVTRDQTNSGGATVSQTLHYNVPLTGFRQRDGAVNVSAIIQLPIPGMGMSVSSRLGATTATTPGTGNGFLTFSIVQP